MKRTSIILYSFLFTLLCSPVYGIDNQYIRINLGSTLPMESDITDSTVPGETVKVKYKASWGVSVAYGSDFGKIRGEFEVAFQRNDLDSAYSSGANRPIFGKISALSYLFNGYYDFDNDTGFTPYVTAGLGFTNLQIKKFLLPATATEPAFSSANDKDFVYTYQVGCGIAYAISRNLSIDINCRRFAPSDPDFNSVQNEYQGNNFYLGLRIDF